MRFTKSIAVAGVVAALALLGACGSEDEPEAESPPNLTEVTEAETTMPPETDPPTTAAAEMPPPCELLTKAEAEALLPGATLLEGIEAGQGDNVSCTYPGDPNGPTAQVEVFVGSGAKKSLEIDRDELDHEFTQPAGIGDEAWLEPDNIFFRVGDTWVQLRVVTLDLTPEAIAANLTAAATATAEEMS